MTGSYTEREVLNKMYSDGLKVVLQEANTDLVVKPRYVEDSVSQNSIDAEVVVLDIDVRQYRYMGVGLKNTGANSLDYKIEARVKYDGTIAEEVVGYTTLSAGAETVSKIDVSRYARIRIYAKATTSGSPSNILVEYVLKT